MLSTIVQHLGTPPGLTALASVVMLMVGGAALLASANRTRGEMLARRVGMVQPATFHGGSWRKPKSPTDDLFRLPLRGVSEGSQRLIIQLFSRAGVAAGRALTYFAAMRVAAAAGIGALALLWVGQVAAFQTSPLLPGTITAMAAIIGWFLPMTLIAYSVKQRTKEVRSGLPDALELLVVCVEAGLSLEDGLDRVVNELQRSQPALADELSLTLADLKILPSRDQALANLAERVDIPSVRSIVTTLTQTLRYGTPLAQSLRVVAAEMRNDYLINLEERANRLPAYLTLPVMLLLMPTIFLIVGGPAALRLLDAFHR